MFVGMRSFIAANSLYLCRFSMMTSRIIKNVHLSPKMLRTAETGQSERNCWGMEVVMPISLSQNKTNNLSFRLAVAVSSSRLCYTVFSSGRALSIVETPGKTKTKRLPPSGLPSIQIRPPIASIACLQKDSPMPAPRRCLPLPPTISK